MGAYTRKDFVRSLLIALVVGTVLVLINVRPSPRGSGGDGGVDVGRILQNYIVPFTVASVSAMLANYARISSKHA